LETFCKSIIKKGVLFLETIRFQCSAGLYRPVVSYCRMRKRFPPAGGESAIRYSEDSAMLIKPIGRPYFKP
jgi:hypothetical protein